MNRKLSKFIDNYYYDYENYLIRDFATKLNNYNYYDNDLIEEIYCYLKIIKFKDSTFNKFYEIINKYFDLNKYKNVLEVASGPIPVLANYIHKKHSFNLSVLEPNWIIKPDDGINLIEDYIENLKTRYDFIYSLRPCLITEYLLKFCLTNDIPFAIYLCDCANNPESAVNKKEWNKDKYHNYLYKVIDIYNKGNFNIIKNNKYILGILKKI